MFPPTEEKIINSAILEGKIDFPCPTLLREGLDATGYALYTVDIVLPRNNCFITEENGQKAIHPLQNSQSLFPTLSTHLAQNWAKGFYPVYAEMSIIVEKWLYCYGIGHIKMASSRIELLADYAKLIEPNQSFCVICGRIGHSVHADIHHDAKDCINNLLLCENTYIEMVCPTNLSRFGYIWGIIPNCDTPLKFDIATQNRLQDYINFLPNNDMCLYYLDEASWQKFYDKAFYNPAIFKLEDLNIPPSFRQKPKVV